MKQRKPEIGTRRDLVLYRLETAKNDLKSARALFAMEKTIEEQITEHIKLSFMRLMPYMLLMEKHIKDTKMLWRISTRIM